MIESNGCEITTSDLAVVMNECEGQVDSMTPGFMKAVE
jgi:hypothetical protein